MIFAACEKLHKPELGAFLLRIALGGMYLAHGLLKVIVFTPAGTIGYFESIGLPAPAVLAWITIIAEVVGGLALIAGAFTRLISLALIPILIGSIVLSHGANGWLFSNEGGGWEYSAFLIMASLAVAFIGPGKPAMCQKS